MPRMWYKSYVSCKTSYKCWLKTHLVSCTVANTVEQAGKLLKCKGCGKSFTHKENLNTHDCIKGDFRCIECGEIFSTALNLKIHNALHLGIGKFKCKDCGQCFFHNHHLEKHREELHKRAMPSTHAC